MAVRSLSLLLRWAGSAMVLVVLWSILVILAPVRPVEENMTPIKGRRLLQLSPSSSRPGSIPASAPTSATTRNFSQTNEDSAPNLGADSAPESDSYEDEGTDATRNCTAAALDEFPDDLMSKVQRRRGGALLHALAAAYLFLLLAVVCHDHFVPSIKILCAKLELSEDVAGATFMAAATSSPELFINGVGTFITQGDIGVGTVVGSGVFNILVVPACCGLFAGKTVCLAGWPLTRDSMAYAATVLLLIASLSDGRVEWYEAASFVALYFLYVLSLCAASRPSCCGGNWLRRLCCIGGAGEGGGSVESGAPKDHESSPLLKRVSGEVVKKNGWHQNFVSANYKVISLDLEEEGAEDALCSPPADASFTVFLWWLLLRPIKATLAITIPDCRPRQRRGVYPLTLIACMAWIAIVSYIVAWMITVVGDTLQIPDSVMGLTLLAAGTSLPEAVSSVIVTNQGYGTMGISNSIGSNTFNILLCLGLPWLLKSLLWPPAPGQYWVNINSGGLLYNTISLLTTLFLLYAVFAYNSFKLDRRVGAITLIMYIGFIAVAFAVELNFFGTVNLPTCPH